MEGIDYDRTRQFRKGLRTNATDAERRIWSHLRDRRLDGHKFRRQYAIGTYTVDFCCIETRLVVELDGGHHSTQMEYDQKRTEFIEKQGFRVLRFWNGDLMKNPNSVCLRILEALKDPHPNPLPL